MQEKHPLEIILENLLLAIPVRGAVKATEREAAKAALEEWRASRTPEPEPNAELTDLRALKEAVRKALTWGPPSPAPSNWQKATPVVAPRVVQAQPVRPATTVSGAIAAGIVKAARMMPTS